MPELDITYLVTSVSPHFSSTGDLGAGPREYPFTAVPLVRDEPEVQTHLPARKTYKPPRSPLKWHGGKHYDPAYGRRMRGRGPIPALLERRFRLASRRLGFQRLPEPVTSRFRAPGEGAGQLRLL